MIETLKDQSLVFLYLWLTLWDQAKNLHLNYVPSSSVTFMETVNRVAQILATSV
jgi:hypothetical protein